MAGGSANADSAAEAMPPGAVSRPDSVVAGELATFAFAGDIKSLGGVHGDDARTLLRLRTRMSNGEPEAKENGDILRSSSDIRCSNTLAAGRRDDV